MNLARLNEKADLLLAFNITLSLVILMVAMYTLRALEFSAFPSLLLIATLFRLALNIASTRLILLHGGEGAAAADQVIKSFGQFVVGGDFIVGMILFAVLIIINFVVITKGAGRIAEIAARFTLDAMPGKQMSIDVDLNAGLINETEARQRRKDVEAEAEFYGAMDGASKFVRGDAVAGLLITAINIVGGFIIGVLRQAMPIQAAAQTYTLLTIGDGLVAQIPALIISTAAGIMVTRAASETNMGKELTAQLLVHPRAMGMAAAILFGFGIIPGLPTLPFLVLSGLAGAMAYATSKRQAPAVAAEENAPSATEVPEKIESLLPLDVLELQVGYALIPSVDMGQAGELLERIKSIRRQCAQEMGIVVPPLHIRDNLQLNPAEYAVLLKGVQKVLQNLVRERVSIRDLLTILEALADYAPLTKDPEILTEFTRQRLARLICKAYQNEQGVLGVIVLEPSIEALLIDAAKRREPGAPLALDPKTAPRLLDRLASTLEKVLVSGGQAVLLCSPTIRAPLKRFLERFLPQLALLSHHEIAPEVQVQSTATVGLSDALETL